ncbi:MAG: hypothetical protein AB3N23_12350 [Paracoccaceae bacterium]
MHFSDDNLRAYLDGQADADLSRLIEDAVEGDPDLEQRLMALDPFAAAVQEAFLAVPNAARLAKVDLPEAERPSSGGAWRGVAVAASLTLAVGLGFFAGRETAPVQEAAAPTWRQQVANYQSLYVPETVASIEASPEQLQTQFERAGAVLGRDLPLEALAGVDGLDLRRAQVLAFNDKPLIQVAFAADNGVPVAFCIIRLDGDDRHTDPAMDQLAGLPSAHWTRDGYGYLLIGGKGAEGIEAMSESLAQVF